MNLAIYLYTPEVYPTRIRAMGLGVTNSISRVYGMIAPVLIGWSLSYGNIVGVFYLLGAFGVVGALATFLFAEETRHRVLEEIST